MEHRHNHEFMYAGSLTRKLVLITNAHRGIGRASALDFAFAGATVVCTARTAEQLVPLLTDIRDRFSLQAYAIPADFSDPAVPVRTVQQIEQNLGPIDILVNINGFSGLSSFAHEENFLQDWWRTLEVNLRAPIALIHAILPSMLARGSGTIITTTLSSGFLNMPFQTADSSTRAAMIRFMQGLDHEVQPRGIYSYVVHPGRIASHMDDSEIENRAAHFAAEPRIQAETTQILASVIDEEGGWSAAGLASGTFVALCAEPRAKVLSGLYVNAETDIEEVIVELEKGPGNRVELEGLYQLKVDEL